MVGTLEKKSVERWPPKLSLTLTAGDGTKGGGVRMRIRAREYLRTLPYEKVLDEISRAVDVLKEDGRDYIHGLSFHSVGDLMFSFYEIRPSEYISVALEILKKSKQN